MRYRDTRTWTWIAVLVAALAVLAASGVGAIVRESAHVTSADLGILQRLSLTHTPFATAIALAIHTGFGTVGATLVTLVGGIVAGIVTRSWREGGRFLLFVAFSWGSASVVKLVVERPRPDMASLANTIVAEPLTTSYPSGHTAFSLALGLAILATVHRYATHRSWVAVAGALAVLLGLVAAWSRTYLGVHNPTDVAASLLLVPIVAWAVWRIQEQLRARSPETPLSLVASETHAQR